MNEKIAAPYVTGPKRRSLIIGALALATYATLREKALADTAFTSFAFPSASGTQPRTMPARIDDILNPYEFGLSTIGGGVVDASNAIQACLSNRGQNAGAVFVPPGDFTISRTMLAGGGSGNASLMLFGSGNGSVIQGNFNGPLLTFGQKAFATTNAATASGNVLHFAAVPASVAAGQNVSNLTTQAALEPDTTVASFTSTTVTLNKNVAVVGVASGDSIAFGSGGGSASSSSIWGVAFWQQSSSGNSSCINLSYSQSVNVLGCYLRGGKNTINGYENPYGAYIGGNKIDPGVGNVGIMLANNTTAIGNDISGNGAVGYRVGGSGSGVTIRGGRIENMTSAAVQLGVNIDGSPGGFANSECGGISLEGNALGVDCRGVSGGVLGPFNIHGEQGGAANAVGGMRFSACSGTKMQGITTSGALVNNGQFWINLNPFGGRDNFGLIFEGGEIGGSVGTLFNVPQDCDAQFINVKNYTPNATQLFANRPGSFPGQNPPLEGCTHFFSDSMQAAGSATAITGGGANKVIGRYSIITDSWYVQSQA